MSKSLQKKLSCLGLVLTLLLSALFTYGPSRSEKIPAWHQVYSVLGLGEPGEAYSQYPLTVTYLDVGQGDSILIHSEDGTVLIDSGVSGNQDVILSTLELMGEDTLDYCIVSHQHADHMGSMEEVVKNVTVNEVLMPNIPEPALDDISLYESFLQTLGKQQISYAYPDAGATFELGELQFQILGPITIGADANNDSLYVKLTYGDTSFLFTGDGEEEEELQVLNSGADLHADVLKVGHHGSKTSSSLQFLQAVSPSVAVISCGKDNEYGHPHEETLDKLKQLGISCLRTDEEGSIIIGSDGTQIFA